MAFLPFLSLLPFLLLINLLFLHFIVRIRNRYG
jgi:hypothetical protein